MSTRDTLEIAGILGVIVSLIFVGFEIRQSSAVAQAESSRATADRISEIALSVTQNPELARLIIDVNLGIVPVPDLDRTQAALLYFYNFSMLQNWNASFVAAQAGVIPKEELDDFNGTYLINPFVIARWSSLRPTLSPAFVQHVEGLELFQQ